MLEKLNRRLKEDNVRVRIEERGQSLNLRASLPDPNTGLVRQQRIPLQTNDPNVADKEARYLADLVQTPGLDVWSLWNTRTTQATVVTFGDFRAAARRLFKEKGYKTDASWGTKYGPALNKLPPDHLRCTTELLVTVVKSMKPNSAARNDQGNVLSMVAKSIGLEHPPIQEASRGYSGSALKERDIPKDEQIEAFFPLIKLPHWRWTYGMIATYGLRAHEIAEARIDKDGNCHIADATKTGFHIAWACNERWIETFSLKKIDRPSQKPERVAKAAYDYLCRPRNRKRTGKGLIPFPLYNLRHAYAIRLFHKGVSSDVASRLMGHSEQVHRRDYKRWYDARDILQIKENYDL